MVCKRMQQLLLPKTRNNMQRGLQTYATCNIQQCCVRLHGFLEKLHLFKNLALSIFYQFLNASVLKKEVLTLFHIRPGRNAE